MSRPVTICMYHFVRRLGNSSYPRIKALSPDVFQGQLKYMMRYYKIISMDEVVASVRSGKELPRNALLLTFDDGYVDHFTNILPILDELGLQGSFFPSAKAILHHEILDVNKIQLILASMTEETELLDQISSVLAEFGEENSLKKMQSYVEKAPSSDEFRPGVDPFRFDKREVVLGKMMLQRELPERVRRKVIKRLFERYVRRDEEALSKELYMTIDQLKEMKRNGMYIGSHGFEHCYLSTIDRGAQERQIDLSLGFLRQVGCDLDGWVFCYPYGAYNDSLISVLRERGCTIGLGTNAGIADLSKDNPLALPRLDTTDLPKGGNAKPNEWTLRVIDVAG